MLWKAIAGPVTGAVLAVVPAAAAAQTGGKHAGLVRDSLTGVPIAGVELDAAGKRAVTDVRGRYRLVVGEDTVTVVLRRVGYAPRRIRAADLGDDVWLARAPELLTGITVSAAPVPSHAGRGSALGLATVDREELGAGAERSLADAVARLEGVSAQQPGAWGGKAFIRGLGGERVTVLLDGDRVNRACNNGMDAGLATIDPAVVERVEVIAGPGSVLYGSGNIGGVINVVTRSPAEGRLSGEVRIGASSAVPGGTVGGRVALRRRQVDLGLSADIAAYDDYRAPGATVDGSSYRHGTFDAKLVLRPARAHELEFHGQRYAGRDIGYPAMAGASIPREDRLLTAVNYGWQVSRGALDAMSAKVFRQGLDHDMEVEMPMTMPDGSRTTVRTEAVTTSITYGGRGQVRLRPTALSRVDAGAEVTEWHADGARWITRGAGTPMASTLTLRSWPDVRVLDAGFFAQGELVLNGAVSVSAGARVDAIRNRADGKQTTSQSVGTGNVGLKVYPATGVVARATLGRGYRVADPTELYGLLVRPDGFVYEGNPSLATETGRNIEAGLSYAEGSLEFAVTAFRNDLHNLISSVLLPDSTISGYRVRQFANVTRARVQGLTARLEVGLSRHLTVRGAAGYTHGANRDTDQPLPLVPPLEGSVTLRASPGGGVRWVEAETRWADRQSRAATGQGEIRTPGYAVASLRASFEAFGGAVMPGVENLFNKTYRGHLDPVRLALPGRNFYVKVVRRF